MNLYFRYLFLLYFKNFIIFLFGLSAFYVGMDLLQNFKDIPNSANLQMLYIVFKSVEAINYLLPLALIFGMLSSVFFLIKTNELVSLLSLGIEKEKIIFIFLFSSLFATILHILFNATPFAYSTQYSKNIVKFSSISSPTKNLFFKYENNYIYFNSLEPLKKEALGVKILKLQNGVLKETISAKKAKYDGQVWILEDATSLILPENIEFGGEGYVKKENQTLPILKDFKPKIMENLQEEKGYFGLFDAILAIKLLQEQNINTQKIKSSLLHTIFFPFFAPILIVIFFYKLPVAARFADIAYLGGIFVILTLVAWGVLFTLSKLSQNGTILPEIAIVAPILLMGVVAFLLHLKEKVGKV